jgi:transposase-like protein
MLICGLAESVKEYGLVGMGYQRYRCQLYCRSFQLKNGYPAGMAFSTPFSPSSSVCVGILLACTSLV